MPLSPALFALLVSPVFVSAPATASTVTHEEHLELTEEQALALEDLSPCKVRWIMRPDGSFTQVEVLECHDGLEERVLEVAGRWTFGSPGPKVWSRQIHLRPPKAPAALLAAEAGTSTSTPQSALAQLMGESPETGAFALTDGTWTKVEATRQVYPTFPSALKQQRTEGEILEVPCTLWVDFDEAGMPTAITPQTCDDRVVDTAMDAAWRWRFAPVLRDGVATTGGYTMRFRFKLM